MKNLLIYTNPSGEFNEENKTLVKIHIDNSLDLGWKVEDILLYTNFPYEYNGVQTKVIPLIDHPQDRASNKIFVIKYLLEQGLKGMHWYHDFDAYQNSPLEDIKEFSLTGYGYKSQINGGSFFFSEKDKEAFDLWCERTALINRTRADEKTMTDMVREGLPHKLLNISYNFGQRCPRFCYKQATKPLKVLHFHPYYQFYKEEDNYNLDIFMYGKNKYGIPMMSERLIKIFQSHGIK